MIYFCADDFGFSKESNARIEDCIKNGALNKISVLLNGEFEDAKKFLENKDVSLCLHINLVEGRSICKTDEISDLLAADGFFKYSFIGLLLLSIFKKKRITKQVYREIQSQIRLWRSIVGEDSGIMIDSHQHTHMIPLVFKTLLEVIKDEGVKVECMRIPDEPILPYIMTPSLYFSYSLSGLAKQWLLKLFKYLNKKNLKKSNIKSTCFMGVLFSGRMEYEKITKILPHYEKVAKKRGMDIEMGFHPGYVTKDSECENARDDFLGFYLSPWRKIEYDTLIKLKIIK